MARLRDAGLLAVAIVFGLLLASPGARAVRPPQQKINLGTDGEATMTNKKNETLKAEASNATDVNMTLPKIGLDMDPKQFAELLKAFWRGTISSNTAEATTPDDGYSSTMSGAINLNPFLDGTALSNSLALSGKNATSDSKGIVFGLIGTGKVQSEATALGKTAAQSEVQGFSVNGLGAQHTVSSNLAFTAGPAKTSVKSAAMTVAGPVVSSGISNAIGVKSATADAKGASSTGFGPSSSSAFSNSFTLGAANSTTGVLSTAVMGPTYSTTGSLATSTKGDAAASAKSKSLSGVGSSTSKAGAYSLGRDASSAAAATNSTTTKGRATSVSSGLSRGVYTTSNSASLATSSLGDANSYSSSTASGAASAAAAANSTARALDGRGHSTSRSSASAGTAKKGLFGVSMLPVLPALPSLPAAASIGGLKSRVMSKSRRDVPSAVGIVAATLAQTAGLKALLPKVPSITPGFASDAAPFEAAVAPGNDTAAPPVCSETVTVDCTPPSNGTDGKNGSTDPMAALGGFFGSLMDKNQNFLNKNNMTDKGAPAAALPARSVTTDTSPAVVEAGPLAAARAAPGAKKKSAVVVLPFKRSLLAPGGGGTAAAASPPPGVRAALPSVPRPGSGTRLPLPLPLVKKPVSAAARRL